MKDNSSHRFMAKVPNTDEGWSKIQALKSIINKDRYRLVYKYNGKSIPNGNGYLLYPMGSYIVKYLNNDKKYLDLLNTILNYGSYVHQFTVNLSKNNFQVKISPFKTSKFRYTYNAGGGYPGNRPIGFKKVS